jgi:hypothetical protein
MGTLLTYCYVSKAIIVLRKEIVDILLLLFDIFPVLLLGGAGVSSFTI